MLMFRSFKNVSSFIRMWYDCIWHFWGFELNWVGKRERSLQRGVLISDADSSIDWLCDIVEWLPLLIYLHLNVGESFLFLSHIFRLGELSNNIKEKYERERKPMGNDGLDSLQLAHYNLRLGSYLVFSIFWDNYFEMTIFSISTKER